MECTRTAIFIRVSTEHVRKSDASATAVQSIWAAAVSDWATNAYAATHADNVPKRNGATDAKYDADRDDADADDAN